MEVEVWKHYDRVSKTWSSGPQRVHVLVSTNHQALIIGISCVVLGQKTKCAPRGIRRTEFGKRCTTRMYNEMKGRQVGGQHLYYPTVWSFWYLFGGTVA